MTLGKIRLTCPSGKYDLGASQTLITLGQSHYADLGTVLWRKSDSPIILGVTHSLDNSKQHSSAQQRHAQHSPASKHSTAR